MKSACLYNYIQGESQNFCHCLHATNYKFVFIKNTVILLLLKLIENRVFPCVKYVSYKVFLEHFVLQCAP